MTTEVWLSAGWTGWCLLSLFVCCHTTSRTASTFVWRSWAAQTVRRFTHLSLSYLVLTSPSPAGTHWSTTPAPPSPVPTAGACSEIELRCENGRCVPAGVTGVVCDGVNDCGDGSDEINCGELTQRFNILSSSKNSIRHGPGHPRTHSASQLFLLMSVTFDPCRHTAIPDSHQSTQLPGWSVLLPSTRGLYSSGAAL